HGAGALGDGGGPARRGGGDAALPRAALLGGAVARGAGAGPAGGAVATPDGGGGSGVSGKLNPDPELERLVQELNERRAGAVADAAPGTFEVEHDFAAELDEEDLRPLPPLSGATQAAVASGDPLEVLLGEAVRRGASDLLLVPGSPPAVRIDGRLASLPATPVGAGAVEELLAPHLGARQRRALRDDGAVDFTLRLDGLSGAAGGEAGWRFRVNLH